MICWLCSPHDIKINIPVDRIGGSEISIIWFIMLKECAHIHYRLIFRLLYLFSSYKCNSRKSYGDLPKYSFLIYGQRGNIYRFLRQRIKKNWKVVFMFTFFDIPTIQ